MRKSRLSINGDYPSPVGRVQPGDGLISLDEYYRRQREEIRRRREEKEESPILETVDPVPTPQPPKKIQVPPSIPVPSAPEAGQSASNLSIGDSSRRKRGSVRGRDLVTAPQTAYRGIGSALNIPRGV